jgi:hypothetical protein
MLIKNLFKELEVYRRANIAVELVSSPGVGKSDAVRQYIDWLKKMNPGKTVGFQIMFMATYTPVDLLGYMIPVTAPDGSKITSFTTPMWMFSTEGKLLSSYDIAVLFIDEYGQGEPDTKKGAAELLLHGQVGPHYLGPNCMRIAASNRMSDRSGVTKSLDFVINRRAEVPVTTNYECWEIFAIEQGIPTVFMFYAKRFGDERIFNNDVPKVQGPWPTARSYVMAINYLEAKRKLMEEQGIAWENYGCNDPESAAENMSALRGIVGEAMAGDLISFIRQRDALPDFDEIVADPDNAKLPSTPDARYMAAHECAFHVTDKNIGQVAKFIARLPQEYSVTFALPAVKRHPRLLLNKDFQQFMRSNQALINAFAGSATAAAA